MAKSNEDKVIDNFSTKTIHFLLVGGVDIGMDPGLGGSAAQGCSLAGFGIETAMRLGRIKNGLYKRLVH